MKTRVYFFDLAIFAHTVAKSRSRRDVNRDTQSIVIQVTIIFRVSNQIHAHLDLFSKSKNSAKIRESSNQDNKKQDHLRWI